MTILNEKELLQIRSPADFLCEFLHGWPGNWECGRKEHKWVTESGIGTVCDCCAFEAIRTLMREIDKLSGEINEQ